VAGFQEAQKQGVKNAVMCQEDFDMRKEEFVMGILIL
jgi:hypothetical protein